MTTFAPASAHCCASSRPMPRVLPVSSTVEPSNQLFRAIKGANASRMPHSVHKLCTLSCTLYSSQTNPKRLSSLPFTLSSILRFSEKLLCTLAHTLTVKGSVSMPVSAGDSGASLASGADK